MRQFSKAVRGFCEKACGAWGALSGKAPCPSASEALRGCSTRAELASLAIDQLGSIVPLQYLGLKVLSAEQPAFKANS